MLFPRLAHACVLGLALTTSYAQLLSSVKRSTPEGSSPVDIAAVIDEVVEEWKARNPDLSRAEIDNILASAEKAKESFLNPSTRRSLESDPEHEPIQREAVQFVPLHRRKVAGLAMGVNSTIAEARAIVRLAQEEASARNRERFENPRLNTYWAHLDSQAALRARAEDMATFVVNETVAVAAAIVAEADSVHSTPEELPSLPPNILELRRQKFGDDADLGAGDQGALAKRATSFWMEDIAHVGRVPFGGAANNDYKVFRNVKDYGAKGDGKTDDTEAINRAMKDQGRCGENCGASTIKPAVVYFPSGTYLVSTSIISYYNTQMVGNANVRPTIRAAKSFVGLGVITVDVYTGKNGGVDQWYINQNNFLRQIRNFAIDLRDADMVDVAGIHWQVAQATSLKHISFVLSNAASKKHMGIFAENGSGGFMSDLTFFDGHIGMRCGNQQFTSRNMVFNNNRIGIDMLWDWGWTWKSLIFSTIENAIKMSGDYRGGSILLLDSTLIGMSKGIHVSTPVGSTQSEKFSITLDNVKIVNVGTAVHHESGSVTLAGGSRTIQSWVIGKVYDEKNPRGRYQTGPLPAIHPTTGSLFKDGAYFEREKPQYETYSPDTFLVARDFAYGNGVADDSFGLHLAFELAAVVKRPLYIPFGSYLITQTIHIPVGTVVVGECWAQLVATGSFFGDMANPKTMVTIGKPGEKGSVEIQDLMFTTKGPTPGAVLAVWNLAESSQGSAAMWDTHFRIGGAQGTELTYKDCPKLTGKVNPKCIAGSMLMHITETSSAYLENIWAWVADHDFDSGPAQTQIDIYVARGILIESQGPLWMYGTASEHCVFYQYLLFGAKDVYMGMLQTESPYYLPSPQAPAPFTNTVGKFLGDPDFKECPASEPHCAAAWGLMIVGSTNIHIHGAGLYNWFIDYTQDCLGKQYCQKRVVNVRDSGQVWFYNLYTIGTWEMLNLKGSNAILAKDNTNTNEHPFTSIVNAWLVASSGEGSLANDLPTIEEDEEWVDEFIIDPQLEPCDLYFLSLDAVDNAKSSIPEHCFDKYLLQAMIVTMRDAINDYNSVVRNGYDRKFAVYAKTVKAQIPDQIHEYMRGAHASGNFRCTQHKKLTCCLGCGLDCAKARKNDKCLWQNCVSKATSYVDVAIDCPTDISATVLTPWHGDQPDSITYTFVNENRFWSDLYDKHGILEDWVRIGKRSVYATASCLVDEKTNTITWCPDDSQSSWAYNYPVYMEANVEIPNPKNMVEDSYDNLEYIYQRAALGLSAVEYNTYLGSAGMILDTISAPALMLVEAVTQMEEFARQGEEIAKAQEKATILTFISAALMIIPLAGRIAGAAGGIAIRAILNVVGETAAAALALYEIADDPSNALFAIIGLFAGGVSRQPFREAAQIRRDMKRNEFNKMPDNVRVRLNSMQKIKGAEMCML